MKLLKNYKSIIIFALMLFIPYFTNNYSQYILNIILVYILVTLGFNIVLGYVGRFSFANAAFFGIGAYTVGLLMSKLNIPFWFSLPIAGIVCAIIGLLVGFPALRLHRYYLAIVTLAFTMLMKFIYIHAGIITYGPSGFDVPHPEIFGFTFSNDKRVYYIVLVCFFLIMIFAKNILQSRIGRSFYAIKGSENAAETLSININKTVLLGFTISGFIVGIAGGLLSIVLRRIVPEAFGLHDLIRQFIMVVLGGLGSISGSIIGAPIIILLPELLREIQEYEEILFGILIVVFVLFAPEGLYGFLIKYIPRGSREKLHF